MAELRWDWIILLGHIILTPLNSTRLLSRIITPTRSVKWIAFGGISIVAMSQIFLVFNTVLIIIFLCFTGSFWLCGFILFPNCVLFFLDFQFPLGFPLLLVIGVIEELWWRFL